MEQLPAKIVSGGQTGVDRAALDTARALGIAQGGWCPRGRLAEDGLIPSHYPLEETDSPEYPVRTKKNVLDSDGTLILYRDRPSGGTELTLITARRHGRPVLPVDLNRPLPVEEARRWLEVHGIRVLNVAGPRESQSPGIAAAAGEFLRKLLS